MEEDTIDIVINKNHEKRDEILFSRELLRGRG